MAIIKCPECGHQVSDKAATCPSCGIEIADKIMRCPDCGAVVFADQELCPVCHCPLHSTNQPSTVPPQEARQRREPNANSNGGNRGDAPSTSVTSNRQETAATPSQPPTTAGEPKKKKRGYIVAVVAVVITLVIVLVAAYFYKTTQQNAENDAYTMAMSSEEPAVLQNYLDMYADAPEAHRDSIQAHLALLMNADREWTDAVVSGSKAAIERYLKMHPNSPHATEGKIKIDSLDWVAALNANTVEAVQAYIKGHPDGMYIDEAHDTYAKLQASTILPDDKRLVTTLFSEFFKALGAADGDALTANVAPVMDNFLTKPNATKTDVVKYMRKVHEQAGESAVAFRLNGDWKIDKAEAANGDGYDYTVSFSVDQKTVAAEVGAADKIDTYKANATVSADGQITSLNLKRLVQ